MAPRASRNALRHGQFRARCMVVRRAERVTCPGIAMNRRRRVGVVIAVSVMAPSRVVQRARL